MHSEIFLWASSVLEMRVWETVVGLEKRPGEGRMQWLKQRRSAQGDEGRSWKRGLP